LYFETENPEMPRIAPPVKEMLIRSFTGKSKKFQKESESNLIGRYKIFETSVERYLSNMLETRQTLQWINRHFFSSFYG